MFFGTCAQAQKYAEAGCIVCSVHANCLTEPEKLLGDPTFQTAEAQAHRGTATASIAEALPFSLQVAERYI